MKVNNRTMFNKLFTFFDKNSGIDDCDKSYKKTEAQLIDLTEKHKEIRVCVKRLKVLLEQVGAIQEETTTHHHNLVAFDKHKANENHGKISLQIFYNNMYVNHKAGLIIEQTWRFFDDCLQSKSLTFMEDQNQEIGEALKEYEKACADEASLKENDQL